MGYGVCFQSRFLRGGSGDSVTRCIHTCLRHCMPRRIQDAHEAPRNRGGVSCQEGVIAARV